MIDVAEKVARAVLYEGHLLYPYRRSALKNRQPWTFGTLAPGSWIKQGSDLAQFQTECLATVTPGTRLTVVLRFLHLSHRKAAPTDAQVIDYGPAAERSVKADALLVADLIQQSWRLHFRVPEEEDEAFRWLTLSGDCEVATETVSERVARIRIIVRNTTIVGRETCRDEALLSSLVSAHAALSLSEGEFISQLDPPAEVTEAASCCRNVGVYPVLIGDAGRRDQMLASPIILYDYPQIADESPGDYFDATEIDEMLALRVLTLTEEEKREMHASGEHARAILERTEAMPPEQLLKVHGVIRGLRKNAEAAMSDWNPFAEPAKIESVRVFGVELRKGDRIRLWPHQRADILDLALTGKTAVIEAIEQDFENQIHFAVVVEDDPGRDLGDLRQPGHRFFFRPDEVEPIEAEPISEEA